jgi:hypothetical protein
MKTIFDGILAGLLALVWWVSPAAAEEEAGAPGKMGFIRLANAVAAGAGPLKLEIDGEDVNPHGYLIGDITGGISVRPGFRKITIRREGTVEGATTVNVAVNETTILIPFAERVPASDTQPAHWAIRVLRLKQQDPQNERSATFVSVSQSPELRVEMREPQGEWKTIHVKRLAITQAPILYPRGYVPLRHQEQRLESIPVGDPGNYVVVLFDDEEGAVSSVNFRDFKFLNAD